jgi:hypothetical protein
MVGTAGNLVTTGMMANAMKGKPLLSNPFTSTAGAGAAGQTATAAGIGYTGPTAGGGYTYGAGTAAAPSSAGAGISTAIPVVGAIAAGGTLADKYGELERDYNDRTGWGEHFSAPGTDLTGFGLTQYMGDDVRRSPVGKVGEYMKRGETALVSRPLSKLASGDIGGALMQKPGTEMFGDSTVGKVVDIFTNPISFFDDWL